MDVLPPTPATFVIQQELTPAQRSALTNIGTTEASRRVTGEVSAGNFRPELVPMGLGDPIQKAAEKYDIPVDILAAMFHHESDGFASDVVRGQRNSSAGAQGVAQFMPGTAAELGVDPLNPEQAIDGGARYLRKMLDMFGGDMRLALTAYNAGPGNVQRYGGPIPGNRESQNYYNNVMKERYRYGGGAPSLQAPETMRPTLAYVSGNIGPTSTGAHLDVKQVGGGRFEETALDQYVEVDDPEFGRVSLGEIRKRTGGIGDSFDQHVARGSHGIDYGLHSGTKVYVKNGAKVIGSRPSQHGDVVTIQLPNGKQYTFLHGNKAK